MRTPLSLAALAVLAVACNPSAVGLPFPTGDVPAGSDRPALTDATDVPADFSADASVACASSRMCPGQVCDITLGRCVDCVTDLDCTGGQFCTAERACVAQVCVPAARECASLRELRVCSANGSAWQPSACPSATSCLGGQCRSRVCTPGTASCESATQRRECNPDGLGYATVACAPMETCSSGTCRAWTCTPGAAACASPTSVSVCNADGLGVRTTTCPTAAGATGACVAGACQTNCAAGFADCDGSATTGCEVNLARDVRHCGGCGMACAAGQSCVGGTCATTTPGQLALARYGHAGVRATDGRVYVFGGGRAPRR